MKKTLLAVLFCLGAGFVMGQANGSYRSRQTGDWNQVATWQVFNSGWWDLEVPGAGVYQNVLPTYQSETIMVSAGTTVTVPAGFEVFVDQVQFEANAVLEVSTNGIVSILNGAGHDLRLYNNGAAFSQLRVAGLLRLHTGATIVNDNYAGSTTAASNATTFNTYKVLNGGVHVHASSDAIPYAEWQAGSTIIFYATNSNPNISDVSVQFYNFYWDGRAQTQNLTFSGRLRNVNGNLTVNKTNGRTLTFGSSSSYTLNIAGTFNIQDNSSVILNTSATAILNVGSIATPTNFQISAGNTTCASTGSTTLNVSGNFIMTNGNLNLRTQTTSGFGATNLNIRGNFSHTGGTITRSVGGGSGAVNFVGSGTTTEFSKTGPAMITNAVNFSVANGKTLALGTSTLTGAGSFTLFNGGILRVGHPDPLGAIQNNTTGGNLRVSGTRTYQAGSTIVYNGSETQFIGTGHPAAVHTTVDNVDSIYMVSDVTINGILTLQQGALVIDNHTLTLGGTAVYASGFIGITPESSVYILGSGNFGNLTLVPVISQAPPNPMKNLSIHRIGGTVTLGHDLVVGGQYTQSTGTFLIGQTPGWSLTFQGPVVQAGGAIALFDNPILTVEGSGALPANLNFTGTGFERLTMNRPSAILSTTSPLTVTQNLDLFNGVVNHPSSNITMGSGAIVTRRSGGSINQPLGAVTSYDVVYDVATPITSGGELPLITPVSTRLGNLTKLGTSSVTLDRDVVINGDFNLTTGTFDVGTGNEVGINGNLVVNGTFLTQQGLVTFGGSAPQLISGTSPALSFFDITVNQPGGSTLTLSRPITVQNNLAVNSASTIFAGVEQLRLLSTATRTANVNTLPSGALIDGTVIVDRFMTNAGGNVNYHYMSSPVENSNFTDWTSQLPILVAYRYNEPTRAYVQYPITNAGTLVPGRGYSVFVNSGSTPTYDTRGTLNQGDILVPLTSQSSDVTSPDGFNLVGNPYPSAISWQNITLPGDQSIADAVYVTDNFNNSGQGAGVYAVSYVDGVSTPAGFTGQIAQGQAFWVKATANTTLTFTEAAKITPTNTQFYRTPGLENILRITIDGQGGKDETVLRIREGATPNFDPKYDAQKFFQPDVSLSTLTSDNAKTVINAFGIDNCNRFISLVPEVKSQGSYQLSFSGLESFDSQVAIALVDREENKTLDVRKLKGYSFTVTDKNFATIATRFQLTFEPEGGVNPEEVVITAQGSTLASSAVDGNQWYLNNILIDGATSNTIEVSEIGVYSVTTTYKGCSSSATHEVLEQNLDNYPIVTIYPNPTHDKVFLRVKTTDNNINATLVNSSGLQLETRKLIGDEDVKEGEFDLMPHASGIYFVRINDGTNVYIRKVAKIK